MVRLGHPKSGICSSKSDVELSLSSAVHNVAAKLSPKFQGPFKVSGILSPVVYELESLEDVRVGKLHVKDLKPYLSP